MTRPPYGPTSVWFLIATIGVGTFGLRLSFIQLYAWLDDNNNNRRVRRRRDERVVVASDSDVVDSATLTGGTIHETTRFTNRIRFVPDSRNVRRQSLEDPRSAGIDRRTGMTPTPISSVLGTVTVSMFRSTREVVYECRRCGTTVDAADESCPYCEGSDLVRYVIE